MPQVDSLFSITPVVSPDTNRPASSSGQVLNQPDLFRFSDSDSTSGFGREASFYRENKSLLPAMSFNRLMLHPLRSTVVHPIGLHWGW
ncbi:MAG: hypothetical protein IPN54_09720 [Bacteroidetes bacterium]|nr:hypothetical protein [Bacteroidota bacterium]